MTAPVGVSVWHPAALMARVTGLEADVAEIKLTTKENNTLIREVLQGDRAERRR